MKLQPGLYIVATPIGNMGDITFRAIELLRNCDYIFSEDTRITKKLLEKHQITTRLSVYNDHSEQKTRDYIKTLINQGKIIALVSDAGTPLISDPGYKLVSELQEEGYHIDTAPGASSVITALVLSGLATDRFLFNGFIPKTIPAKEKTFKELENLKATLIFFETSPRLIASLSVALDILGDREATIARELTKLYQTIKRDRLSNLIKFFTSNPARGEIVLLISGEAVAKAQEESLEGEITKLLAKGMSTKDIANHLHQKYPELNKKAIYNMAKGL